MESTGSVILNETEFVERFFIDMDTDHGHLSSVDSSALIEAIENPQIENPQIENSQIENPQIKNPQIKNPQIENPQIEAPNKARRRRREYEDERIEIPNIKPKRRANLTEFTESQTTKRKNESAKRELTSVVNQLGKIDKQLNTKDDKSRVAINFVATFTSFKSNRENTFKYPLDAEIKQTLLDYDTTISAVKNAVKEAVNDLAKELPRKEPGTAIIASSTATEDLMTPTKTIAAFTALPSPVSVKGQPVSSKNLCTKNSCTFGKKLRKHVWIKCSHRIDEGQRCAYWVHASCIGFPNLKEENVKLLDGWCCPEHTEVHMKRK